MSGKKLHDGTGMTGKQRIALLRSRIRFHAGLGIDAYPANSGLRRFFVLTDSRAGDSVGPRTSGPKTTDPATAEIRQIAGREEFDLLNREIAGCVRCRLAQEKSGNVFGRGKPPCSLMVVGDWSQQEAGFFSPGTLFGRHEDAMVEKMMAAIGLKPDDVYVTNCLKCCPGEAAEPDRLCTKSCFSFLEREIALIRPGIICAMGDAATAALTGSTEPLARMRGKFVTYRYQAGPELAVMPTYHPRFLLRHREMKKATWLDLQAIKRKLAGKKE